MMERAPILRTHLEEERKKLIEDDHAMIRNPYNDEIRKYLIPDSMISNFNNDSLSPKRTPEDRAKSPGYLKDSDQTWKV